MATENLEEGVEVTPEAFEDLQKRLGKAEKKLAKAKSRAQATMQEIWQLDVKLKEEEERANAAEARLAELDAGGSAAPSADGSAPNAELEQEIEQLRAQLTATREDARVTADKLAEEAQAAVQELQNELDSLREQAESAEQLKTANLELEEQISSLKRLLDEAGEKEADNDAEQELQEQIQTLQDELAEAQEQAAEASLAQAKVEELEAELQQVRAELESSLAAAQPGEPIDVERFQEKIGELEASKASLQEELEGKLSELEEALDEARARADRTAEESLDSSALEEAQSRIRELETQLQEAGSRPTLDVPEGSRLEFLEAKLAGLRIALHEAEERARNAENRIDGVGDSTSAFEEQLKEVQAKVREAEERALEWEERFHKSEERATRVEELAQSGSEEGLVLEFQDRISELETELAEVRQSASGGEGADSEELEELRRELLEAQDRVSELEARGGVNIEEFQRLERELAEFQQELEDANRRADRASKRAELAEAGESSEVITQYKERLSLADERMELLQEKARQASEKLDMAKANLQELQSERDKLKGEVAELNQRLQETSGKAQTIGLSTAATETRLQEALQRARDAELKANQSEIQLQKATAALQEYEQRANESDRETQRLAFQDGLTGLPNLNLIRQYLEFTVKQVQRYNRASALLVVDLDRFKLINDAMGFKAGDELLIKVAERLQTAIRESDALGRKGEDEFLILLSELITGNDDAPPEQKTNMIRQNIAIVVNRISECLSRPFHIQGQKFYIRASIGVSICPNDANSAQEMLEHADSAMYHAKESGRGRCVFYNNELHKRQERRLTMDSQLRLAMEKGEFVLQYQPIIEMTKGKGSIVGVEALLRWNHRIDGLLEPSSFLNIAEETGLIVQLGQWVARQSCWQLRQWLSQGHNIFVSFNVSTRQMLQADLAEMILGSVEEFGLQPGLVFVEMSEGTNVEQVDLIERTVANLGRAGMRVAIDDFGIGYSSLSRIDLKHIQFLKVDPSLVAGCVQDKAKANICEAAIKLANSLELRALAEGVESLAQAKFLTKVGCQFLQGYHIQPPADAAAITQMLNEKKAWKF